MKELERHPRPRRSRGGSFRMHYVALCPPSEAAKPGLGQVARSLETPVLQAFSGYVIPHRTKDSNEFTEEQCLLYVSRREWLAKYNEPEGLSDE